MRALLVVVTLLGLVATAAAKPRLPALTPHRGKVITASLPRGWQLEELAGDTLAYLTARRGDDALAPAVGLTWGDFGRDEETAAAFLAAWAPSVASAERELEAGQAAGGKVAWAIWGGKDAGGGEQRIGFVVYLRSKREILVVLVAADEATFARLGGLELARAVARSVTRPVRVPRR